MEEWKEIRLFTEYKVSNKGRILSLKFGKEKIIKGYNLRSYQKVYIFNKYGRKGFSVHRLVAQAFLGLDISNSKICVCHKKEDLIDGMLDNSVANLWLGTHKENMQDCSIKKRFGKPGLGKFGRLHYNSRKVNQYTKEGDFIKTWCSIRDIERDLFIHSPRVIRCCRGQNKTASGYKWEYFKN